MTDLGEMSLSEFVDNWDTDEDEMDTQAKAVTSAKKKKTKKKAKSKENHPVPIDDKSHQKQLNQLKEKDPEFYKFLQDQDESLLHFNDENFDIDESSDDDSEAGIHKMPTELEEASDLEVVSDGNDSDFQDEVSETKKDTAILVTVKMISEWKDKLMQEKSSLPALKELMKGFHAAVLRFTESGQPEDKESKLPKSKYKVLSSEIFNAIVGLCIQQVVPSLAKILHISQKQSSNMIKPQRKKSWDKVRSVVQYYLQDVIMLDQLLLEPTVLGAALRHTILLIPYYLCFPKITKQLLKFLIKTWSGFEDESIRVLAFLCINRIAKLDGDKYLDTVLKQCYLAYVSNCKFTSPTLLPVINFLQQTLCELFAIKPQATYPIAFLYIRQLAIHLRKAMTVTKKENYQAVYNWQFVHCIGLWCRMVGNMSSDAVIKPLLYPLVQVSLGTIDLLPTTRYFPLRYRVVKYLITLMEHTNVYIPLLPYITKPIRLVEFSKKSGAVMEPLNFATMLRLSNSQLKGSSYRSTAMDEMYDALMEYVNTQAHTISFPEMIVPTLISLKKYTKGCKVATFSKPIQQLLTKFDENSKFIIDRRSRVDFGVADVQSVSNWERSLKNEGVPFHKHFKNYKKSRQVENRLALADKDRTVEERLPQIDRKKFIELAKAKDRQELTGLFVGDEEYDFGGELDDKIDNMDSRGRDTRKTLKHKKQETFDDDDEADDSTDGENNEDGISDEDMDVEDVKASPKKIIRFEDELDEPDLVDDFQFSSDEEK